MWDAWGEMNDMRTLTRVMTFPMKTVKMPWIQDIPGEDLESQKRREDKFQPSVTAQVRKYLDQRDLRPGGSSGWISQV